MPHLTKASTSTANSDILLQDTTSPSSVDDSLMSRNLAPPSSMKSPTNMPPLSPAISGFNFGADRSEPASPTVITGNYDLQQQARKGSVQKPQDWDNQSVKSTKSNKSNLKDRKKSVTKEQSRRNTQYFEDSFAYKEGWETSNVDKTRLESPVVAELRTNVIIKDEYSLVTDLSQHVAARFQRPESAVMITITHSACLMYGGTFEPAYLLNIGAVEAHTQAATNKRNTALMQGFLSEILGVTPDRGIVRFQPIKDDCLGTQGRTIAGEIDRRESETGTGIKKALTNTRRKSSIGASMKRRMTTAGTDSAPLPGKEDKKDKRKSMISDKRKSFMSLGGNKSGNDQKQQLKQRRISLHPPSNMNQDVPSSGSTTPELPSPVYLNINGAVQNVSDPINGNSGIDATVHSNTNGLRKKSSTPLMNSSPSLNDPTKSLLSEASSKLSTLSLPQPNGRSFPPQPQPQPQQRAASSPQGPLPPKSSFGRNSRPSSRKSLGNQGNGPYAVQSGAPPVMPPPPAIPTEKPMNTVSKRKSIMAMFRRTQTP